MRATLASTMIASPVRKRVPVWVQRRQPQRAIGQYTGVHDTAMLSEAYRRAHDAIARFGTHNDDAMRAILDDSVHMGPYVCPECERLSFFFSPCDRSPGLVHTPPPWFVPRTNGSCC